MKKKAYFVIAIVLITLLLSNFLKYYFINNVHLGINVGAQEREYPEYTDKLMGFGGYVRNKTIFPIRVKDFKPIGIRGMKYFTILITPWGFSEIKKSEIKNYECLDEKIILPFEEYSLGVFFKFDGDYVVNPDAYEVTYSVLGINFKSVIYKY